MTEIKIESIRYWFRPRQTETERFGLGTFLIGSKNLVLVGYVDTDSVDTSCREGEGEGEGAR